MAVKITDLGQAVLPLVGTEVLEIVQGGDSRQVSADDLAAAAAGLDATFVTVTANPDLPNERILTAGANINIVDGGAGNPITISVVGLVTSLFDLTDTNLAGQADNDLLFRSGGVWIDTAGLFTFDGTDIGHAKFGTQTTGIQVRGALDNDPATGGDQDISIDLANLSQLPAGSLSFLTDVDAASPDLYIRNKVHDGRIIIQGQSNTGVIRNMIEIDPTNVMSFLYQGQQVFRTNDPSVGSIQMVNEQTSGIGAGSLQRVFTEGDRGAVQERWFFSTATDTTVTPAFKDMRMNSATPASVTQIAVQDSPLSDTDFGRYWGPTLAIGDKILLKQQSDETKFLLVELTGVPIDQGGFWNFTVSIVDSGARFDSIGEIVWEFFLADYGVGGGGGVNSVTGGTNINDSGTAADPILNVDDPLIIGSVNATSALSAGDTGASYTNVPINIGANLIGTMPMTQLSRQRIQTKSSSLSFNATLFINIGGSGTNGSDTIIGSLNGAQLEVAFGVAVRMKHGLSGTDIFETIDTGILLPEGSVFIDEKAAAESSVAARGEFWVRNDVPNTPMFTTDTGVDIDLSAGGGVNNPMTVDLDGDGFNFDDMGVMFMREQATADGDVSTQGQLWVRTDAFSNTLMFTNDNGNDIEVAGLPLCGDALPGTLVLATASFAGVVNIGPNINHLYRIIITGEVTAPAIDDIKLELTVDTNSVFKGVYTDSDGQNAAIESVTGEVITNTIVVPTDGSATPNGVYFQIIGMLQTGGTGQTFSLRAAKNADGGADGGIHGTGMSVQEIVES